MKVAAFLALSIAGALGATVAAAVHAEPAVLAGALAIAFLGLACAAGAAAIELHAPDDLREPRVAHGPTDPPPLPRDGVTRRVFGRMWFAALGAFAVLGLVPLISLARRPGRRVLTGWRDGVRLVDENDHPIEAAQLVTGGIATVFPQHGIEVPEASAVLIRVPPELLTVPGAVTGASPEGYVAFSKICTHAGCPVALYREQSHELYCPCHQSRFDILAGAKNLSGPAPRPLPQLLVAVDAEGYLIARGDFNGPVGPDDWDRVL